jgi:hypothetical protein
MEQSSSRETNSSAGQIPQLLWNLKVHYCVHRSLPVVPVLSQINSPQPIHPIPPISILILSSHLCLGLMSSLSLSGFPNKIVYAFLISVHAKCATHLIPFDLHKIW